VADPTVLLSDMVPKLSVGVLSLFEMPVPASDSVGAVTVATVGSGHRIADRAGAGAGAHGGVGVGLSVRGAHRAHRVGLGLGAAGDLGLEDRGTDLVAGRVDGADAVEECVGVGHIEADAPQVLAVPLVLVRT
jgi:hypothetical protein